MAVKKLRINTIFWKIFFSYLMAMLLVFILTASLLTLYWQRDIDSTQRDLRVRLQATTALTIYEAAGERGLRRWMTSMPRFHSRRSFLLDANKQDILKRPLRPGVRSLLADPDQFPMAMNGQRLLLEPLQGKNGERYWYLSISPERHPPPMMRRFMPPGANKLFLLVAVLVFAGISYLLARHFTAPIKLLGRASQQFSAGDFSTQVIAPLLSRRDELGDLAREFMRMAEQLDTLLTSQQQMLRDVSHELRSPMARMQVALELARTQEDPSASLARIEQDLERLNTLVGEVLSLVRLEHQSSQTGWETIDLTDLVNACVKDADFEAQSQSKRVVFPEPIPTQVQGQEELLVRAIENTLRNAIQHSPEASQITVSIDIENAIEDRSSNSGDKAWVHLRIRDQGPGVPEAKLDDLFKPFFRLDDARTHGQGYGLGLAIVARSMDLHGGRVRAFNHQDGGLVVELSLPTESLDLQ